MATENGGKSIERQESRAKKELSIAQSDQVRRMRARNTFVFSACSELIIRCIDRQLETLTLIDADSLESFLHDQIVSLWDKSGWMTAK